MEQNRYPLKELPLYLQQVTTNKSKLKTKNQLFSLTEVGSLP